MTPNIDRLAIEGSAVHAGLFEFPGLLCDAGGTDDRSLSGSSAVGLEEPIPPRSPQNVGLPPSHPTLPSLLKKAGYGTALVGKWHLGYLPDFSPLKSGYDQFFGIFGSSADYFNHGERLQAYPLRYPGSRVNSRAGGLRGAGAAT